jgi:signal transduction histidine kinase
VAFYYAAAEALTNVAKYAQATIVEVTVELDDHTATLAVADNGVGGVDLQGGSGLQGLRDRMAALGGTLQVESTESGTTLTATAPI